MKSVVLTNQQISHLLAPLQINDQPVPVVPVAKYLGILMNSDGVDVAKHVQKLTAKGWAAYGHLQRCGLSC